jgi:hypothetical protein
VTPFSPRVVLGLVPAPSPCGDRTCLAGTRSRPCANWPAADGADHRGGSTWRWPRSGPRRGRGRPPRLATLGPRRRASMRPASPRVWAPVWRAGLAGRPRLGGQTYDHPSTRAQIGPSCYVPSCRAARAAQARRQGFELGGALSRHGWSKPPDTSTARSPGPRSRPWPKATSSCSTPGGPTALAGWAMTRNRGAPLPHRGDHRLDRQQIRVRVQQALAAGPCQFYLLVLATPEGASSTCGWA